MTIRRWDKNAIQGSRNLPVSPAGPQSSVHNHHPGQHAVDERRLPLGIGLAIQLEFFGQLSLQCGIFSGQGRISAQGIAKGQPLLP